MVVDHLSKIDKPAEDKRGTEIEKNFPYEQLLQVKVQLPWYDDLVNYLAYGFFQQNSPFSEEEF